MDNNYNLVIGAGITGITVARKLAEKGETVLLVEKRNHVGGNCYDYFTKEGIYVQKYGPHIFHTKDGEVWEFLSRFTEWHNYKHKVLASVDGKYIPLLFNLNSIKIAFSEEQGEIIKKKLIDSVGSGNTATLLELTKTNDQDLKVLFNFIYQKIFLNYTLKQWDLKPEEIEPSVTARVPVFVSEEDAYFPKDKYQGIPSKGFTFMFKKMLNHGNIKLLLQADYKEVISFFDFKRIIVTSPLDEFFSFEYGHLAYRNTSLKFEEYEGESFQENSVINYPNDYDYTRITEFNKFLDLRRKSTIIAKEYPSWDQGFPAYPLLTEKNKMLIEKYKEKAEVKKNKKIFFAGRMAECKYYDMDQACRRGLDLVREGLFAD